MMRDSTAPQPAVRGGWDTLADDIGVTLAVVKQAAMRTPSPEIMYLAARLADLQHEVMAAAAPIGDRRLIEDLLAERAATPEQAPRRPASHRAARQRQRSAAPARPLRAVEGVAPPALGAATVKRWLGHHARAQLAHPAAYVAAGAAASVVLAANVHLTPYTQPLTPKAVAPAAALTSAPPASAAVLPVPAAKGRHRHRAPMPPPVPVRAPHPSPRPPSPSFSPPSPVPAGTLLVSRTVITLAPGQSAAVGITARGGPVSWTAQPQPGVLLSAWSGTLAAGEDGFVVVSVDPAAARTGGSAVITFEPGNVAVTVMWSAPAASPSPSASVSSAG